MIMLLFTLLDSRLQCIDRWIRLGRFSDAHGEQIVVGLAHVLAPSIFRSEGQEENHGICEFMKYIYHFFFTRPNDKNGTI